MGIIDLANKKKNLGTPTVLPPAQVQTKTVPAQPTSFLDKVGNFAKEIIVAPVRALATPFGLAYQGVKNLATGQNQEDLNVPVLGNIGLASKGKELAGQVLERDVDLLLSALTVAGGGAAAAEVKSIAGTAAKQGGKTALKQAASAFLKTLPVDFGIGASYGLAGGLQEKAKADELLKRAATGGIIGAIAPPVIGAGLRISGAAVKGVSKELGDALERAAVKAEERAAAGPTTASKSRFYEQIDKPIIDRAAQKAEKTAKTLRNILALPERLKTAVVDKYNPVRLLQDRLAKNEGINADLLEEVQGMRYRAYGKAENKLDDYLMLRDSYGSDWKSVKEYSHYLDDLDRLSQGQTIAGGRSVADVESDMNSLMSGLSAKQKAGVVQGQKDLQKFLNKELLDAVESGRISAQQFETIKEAHPNYIPHDVLDFLDVKQPSLGRSFQLTKSGIEKAKGSERAIDDIDNAVTRRIFRQSLLDEKNKTNLALFDNIQGIEDKYGFSPLRTAENVKRRREYFAQIESLRSRIDSLDGVMRSLKTPSKEAQVKYAALTAKLRGLEDTLAVELHALQGEDGNLDKFYQSLIERRDSVDAARAGIEAEKAMYGDSYTRFKDLMRRKDAHSMDVEQLRLLEKKLGREFSIFDGDVTHVVGGDDRDILTTFQKLFEREKQLAGEKIDRAGIRKFGAVEKRTEQARGRLGATEGQAADARQNITNIENDMSAISTAIDAAKEQKKALFDDVKMVKDLQVKAVDVPKGFERYQFLRDGVREEWIIPRDLAGALRHLDGNEATAALSFLNNTVFGRAITAPSRALRAIATTYNPSFAMLSNPIRDVQTAAITSSVGPADFAKGLALAIGGARGESDELLRLARESGALQGGIYRETSEAEKILEKKIITGNPKTSLFDKTYNDSGQGR
jgi:hypothetical protein